MLHHISKSTTIYESCMQQKQFREVYCENQYSGYFIIKNVKITVTPNENIPSNQHSEVHVLVGEEIHKLACLLKRDVR